MSTTVALSEVLHRAGRRRTSGRLKQQWASLFGADIFAAGAAFNVSACRLDKVIVDYVGDPTLFAKIKRGALTPEDKKKIALGLLACWAVRPQNLSSQGVFAAADQIALILHRAGVRPADIDKFVKEVAAKGISLQSWAVDLVKASLEQLAKPTKK